MRLSTERELAVRPGDVVDGKFRIERLIGTGGMGAVVAAMHLELHQRVALKFVDARLGGNEHAIRRFLREARAAARLKGEHVGRVFDVGRLPNGAPFLVMEYLEGQDLESVLDRDGPLPVADAIEYALQVCQALGEAHLAGVIHRDIKPGNLFLTHHADGRALIKVLDFGISKVREDESVLQTARSVLLGSPAYMSPEQIRTVRDIDARSDLWSVGVVLYQLLTGELPFWGRNPSELILRIMEDEPRSVHQLRPSVPVGVDAAVRKCLAKSPDDRFATAAELSAALIPFAPARARAAAALISRVRRASEGEAIWESTPVEETRPELPTPLPLPAPRPRRRTAAWIAGAAVAMGLGAAGELLLDRSDPPAPERPAPPPAAPTPPPPEPEPTPTPAPAAAPAPASAPPAPSAPPAAEPAPAPAPAAAPHRDRHHRRAKRDAGLFDDL